MKYHLDRNQDKSAEELRELNRKMVELQKAFEWLRNKVRSQQKER
jgi:DnaJ-class molecular chaperone